MKKAAAARGFAERTKEPRIATRGARLLQRGGDCGEEEEEEAEAEPSQEAEKGLLRV